MYRITIDYDLPRFYRLPFLRYRRLRRKLRLVLRALKIANLLPTDILVYRSATGKGFHVVLYYNKKIDDRAVRALCNDDPVRLAWDLLRKNHEVRTGRIRTLKRRRGRRRIERPDKKGTEIARNLLQEFLEKI